MLFNNGIFCPGPHGLEALCRNGMHGLTQNTKRNEEGDMNGPAEMDLT